MDNEKLIFNHLKQFIYNKYLLYLYIKGDTKQYFKGGNKSKFQMLKELILWELKENDFNNMYYAMGLNLKDNKSSEFFGRKEFLRVKNKVEKKLKKNYGLSAFDYDIITKDKFYSSSILEANGIPSIKNIGLLLNDLILFKDGSSSSISYLKELPESFILKNVSLEAGEGVFVCEKSDDKFVVNNQKMAFEEIVRLLKGGIWVLQNKIRSHEIIRKINNTALNTTRIVTILNDGKPEYLGGFQAFATDNATTDSWSSNSIYVGIDIENSCLKEYGFTNLSDKRDGLISEHPNSNIKFADYNIPFLRESVLLCIRAHSIMYNNFVVGWDVAITDNGPLIVEANEKPGMNVVQCTSKAVKSKLYECAHFYFQNIDKGKR